MTQINRRGLITAAAAMGATGGLADVASASAPLARSFTAQPLPFAPGSITGLSEKLLVSHHDNNYVGAVKRLGSIATQFAALDPATAPGFTINGLKREELIAWKSMILHELYFASLGQPSRPGEQLSRLIEQSFGSFGRWAAEFTGMGKALAGGSGWVLLTWSDRDKCLVNQWAADHTMTLADATPILALDMYEHAYAIDYGAKAGAYVDAFMKAVNWSSADQRMRRVVAADAV
jgi:Fe-Mn family superoxide dismutase